MARSRAGGKQGVFRITLFGEPKVEFGAAATLDHFQTRQTALLLARLAYDRRRHYREQLVDLLWPDADLESGRRRLSQALSWLKAQFEILSGGETDVLLVDRATISLSSSLIETDVDGFERAIVASNGAHVDNVAQAAAMEDALRIYGDAGFLPGFYDDWSSAERSRLSLQHMACIDRLIQYYETTGQLDAAIALAQRSINFDRTSEEAHCHLIRLLAADGRYAAAQRQYRDLKKILTAELGSEPLPATEQMMQEIVAAAAGEADRPRADPQQRLTPQSVPSPLTRFFGRSDLIADVCQTFSKRETRLITLTGTAGTGKTRAAIAIAQRMTTGTGGNVAFVELADVSDSRLIPETILESLGIRVDSGAALAQIIGVLTSTGPIDMPFLLVLDNADHLIAATAQVVTDLLKQVPGLLILATSRRHLAVEGELEIDVPPLSVPGPSQQLTPAALDVPSVALFVDRSRLVRPDFPITGPALAGISRLCERLEGLPLAIELCAAWAQTLSVDQMLVLIDRRFDLLVSRRADISPRHRTLRAALEYSYLQLPEVLQKLFVSLSVFRGGWTLDAANAVANGADAASSMVPLADLREHSLISTVETRNAPARSSEMRYRMLESVREFAAEQRTLAVGVPLRKRHADYFLALAEEAEHKMVGLEQSSWLNRLDQEHDNMHAALEWLLERQESDKALCLAVALSGYWETRGNFQEARHWFERTITSFQSGGSEVETAPDLEARALSLYATVLRDLSEFERGLLVARKSLDLWRTLGEPLGTATALEIIGSIAFLREDYDQAKVVLKDAMDVVRQIDDKAIIGRVAHSLGRVAIAERNWDEAELWISESLAVHDALDSRALVAAAYNNLGLVARYRGDLVTARDMFHQALAAQMEVGDRPRAAITHLNIGTINRLDGRYVDARFALETAAAEALDIGERRVQAWSIKELAHLVISATTQYATGLRLLACAEAWRDTIGMSFNPLGPEEIARDRVKAESALDPDTALRAWNAGHKLKIEEAVDEALATLADISQTHNAHSD